MEETQTGQSEDSQVAGQESQETNVQSETGATEETQGQETQKVETDLGKIDIAQLPKELHAYAKSLQADYTRKTQSLAEQRKTMEQLQEKANALDQLAAHPEFVKWYQTQTQAQQKQEQVELSDEEFQQAMMDKSKLVNLVQKTAEGIVKQQYGPVINELQTARLADYYDRELDGLSEKYSDFGEISNQGLLDKFVKAGYDYETAYQKYKFETSNQETQKKAVEQAHGIVQKKKAAVIERPGGSIPVGKKVVKAKNFSEAFDQAFEAVSRGENLVVEKS